MAKPVMVLEGVKELRAALAPIAPKLAKAVFKKAATRFAAETRDALRGVEGDVTGNLRKATKSKSTKGGGAVVYVDRSGGSSGKGYHAHIHKKGAKARKTKKGGNRGASPANARMDQVLNSQAGRFLDSVGTVVLADLKARVAKGRK